MMMKRGSILAATALALLLPASEAAAFKAQEGTQRRVYSATKDTRRATNDVRQEVRESADRTVAALRAHAGEASAYADKQIEGVKRLMDAAELNETNRLRQEFRAKAEGGDFDPDPSICLIAGLFGAGDGGTSADAARNLGSNAAAKALSAASGGDPAVQAGGTTLARSIIDDRARFKGKLGVSDPTTNPASIVMNPTISTKDPEAAAAIERLIRNMVDPTPPKPLTADDMKDPVKVAAAAKRTVQETRAATAAEALAMVVNMRAEVGPVTDEWKAYVEDIAGYNREVGEDMSELQGIDIRTLRYYAPSEEALKTRNTMSDKGLLQVLVDQMSLSNRIAFLQLELDSRRAMVETQILSALNNN